MPLTLFKNCLQTACECIFLLCRRLPNTSPFDLKFSVPWTQYPGLRPPASHDQGNDGARVQILPASGVGPQSDPAARASSAGGRSTDGVVPDR